MKLLKSRLQYNYVVKALWQLYGVAEQILLRSGLILADILKGPYSM